MDRGRGRFPLWPHRRPASADRRDCRSHRRGRAPSLEALKAEYDALEAEYAEADELPDEVDQRLGEIEAAMATFENRPVLYEPAEIARAGIFVSIDGEGALRVERGFVRPEDEPPIESVAGGEAEGDDGAAVAPGSEGAVQRAVITIGAAPVTADPETAEEDETIRPLSDRLVTELTAHRTLALRDAVANDPHIAFLAVLHALCLHVFYRYAPDTCLEIYGEAFGFQRPGAGPGGHTVGQRRSRQNTLNGPSSCPKRRTTCGTL